MRNNILKATTIVFASALAFSACKKPEDAPIPVEQELITTMNLVVTGSNGFNKTFTYKVDNGFGNSGGNTTKDVIELAPNTDYDVEVRLLNEQATPAEDVTAEVIEENEEHLFLFQSNPVTGNGAVAFNNGNKDNAGNAFNQKLRFSTAAAGNGSVTVTLKHQPTNKAGTTPDAAGGDTDVEATYEVKIQ